MIHVSNGHFVVLDGKDPGISDLFLSGTPLIAVSGEFQARALQFLRIAQRELGDINWHHESVSRGGDNTPEKLARFASEEKYMHERWGNALRNDPFYNPNLSLTAADWTLSAVPSNLSARLPSLQSSSSDNATG